VLVAVDLGAFLPHLHQRPGLSIGARSYLPLPQVVSSNPYLGDGRGAASLRLLKVLHGSIHPLLGQRWEITVPLLLEYLDGEARG
jgi:hypothetical protein